MSEQLTERARISFWWPSSSHPVWTYAGKPPADVMARADHWRTTYCFTNPFFKQLVQRKYRMLRRLGATPIAARWACDTECQRQMRATTIAEWRHGGEIETPIGVPMAFFPPEPCAICGEFDHDEWDDNAHPSEGDDW